MNYNDFTQEKRNKKDLFKLPEDVFIYVMMMYDSYCVDEYMLGRTHIIFQKISDFYMNSDDDIFKKYWNKIHLKLRNNKVKRLIKKINV